MTAGLPEHPSRLLVPGPAFVQELKRLAKVLTRRNSAGDATFAFADGELQVRVVGATFGVPAEGRWNGEAVVSGEWLRALARVPPAGDPLVFQISGGRLRIGAISVPCQVRTPGDDVLEVPIDADLPTLLRLALAHDDEQLARAGVQPRIAVARRELERRIALAARHLTPFGVGPTDLRLLVAGKLAAR